MTHSLLRGRGAMSLGERVEMVVDNGGDTVRLSS